MFDLRHVLVEEFIKADRQFRYISYNKIKLRATCEGVGCLWVLYARLKRSDNTIVRINTLVVTHNCDIVFYNTHVTSRWIASHFLEQFRLNPRMEYNSFKAMVVSSKFCNVSSPVFYRTRKLA